ncbi:MAG TPA: LemA family protein [Clostridia bacterium]|mgnify:CR=1 FL=1|nr:LemA family protein [Clostridia bacterium]
MSIQNASKRLSSGAIALIVIGAVILIMILSAVGSYNSLVNLDTEIDNAQADIGTQLQRRLDLIPNLVNTVKGYAAHEQEAIDKVTEARAKLAGAKSMTEQANANSELESALSRLLVVVENYPDLKANTQFTALMDELAGTENRISIAREDYNKAVKDYNAKIRRFPSNIIANLFGFEKRDFFTPSSEATNPPVVEFE